MRKNKLLLSDNRRQNSRVKGNMNCASWPSHMTGIENMLDCSMAKIIFNVESICWLISIN